MEWFPKPCTSVLWRDIDFTDVTLACEDQSIKAHKMVLSSCSPFFKKLLKTHSHPQPLIYMRGMRANSLTAIIDFLCLGEANVFQDDLDDFLALAEELQLKGFDGISEGKVPDYPTESSNHTEKKAVVNQKQMPKKPMSIYVKFEKEGVGAMMTIYGQKPRKNSLIEPATMAEIESMIEQRIDGKYCTICGYTLKILATWKNMLRNIWKAWSILVIFATK